MKKKLSYLTGTLTAIMEIKNFTEDNVPKALLYIETEDKQLGFFEVRIGAIQQINDRGIKEGDKVEIGYVFLGRVKGNKVFNNLFINEIKHAK